MNIVTLIITVSAAAAANNTGGSSVTKILTLSGSLGLYVLGVLESLVSMLPLLRVFSFFFSVG